MKPNWKKKTTMKVNYIETLPTQLLLDFCYMNNMIVLRKWIKKFLDTQDRHN